MADAIGFDNIPGSGLVAPIMTFEVTSGGQFESNARLLLIGHKNTGAAIADNVPTICNTDLEAQQLAGVGSMLADMFRVARMNAPAQEIWICAAPATGTAEVRSITIDSVPASGGYFAIEIAGHPVTLSIGAGDTAADVATALAAAINGFYDELTRASLPVTAAVDGVNTDQVNVTARHAGAIFNDLDIYVPTTDAGNVAVGNVTLATTTAGSGVPDLSAALASLGDDQFDWIVSPFADDTNLGRYETALNDVSGRWAWDRQVYGHVVTVTTGTTSEITTLGLGENDRHVTIVPRIASSGNASPAWVWAAGFAGRVVPWLSDGVNGNVSRNQTGLTVLGVRAPRDRSKWPGYAARNVYLKSGISTWSVTSDGQVAIDKLITTYQKNPLGQTDTTFRDIQWAGQMMYVLRNWRAMLSYEHGQKALADDNPGNLAAISTPRDIKATLIQAHEQTTRQGVTENTREFAKRLAVKRNADNPNRVDVMAPIDRVNPLDIIAANARLYSQYRQAAA